MVEKIHLVVGPVDDLFLSDGLAVCAELGEEGEGVGLHQLPHKGQRELLVTLFQVRACTNVYTSMLKHFWRLLKMSGASCRLFGILFNSLRYLGIVIYP